MGERTLEDKLEADVYWGVVEAIAHRAGVSLPAFALRCGLDQSTLSPARMMRNWPSLQTMHKVLKEVGLNWTDFAVLYEQEKRNKSQGN